jgi:predicted DNA binding CopG/RHH family protein
MSMSKRMTVRFDDNDLNRLRSYAKANGLDIAKAIREVVTTFLTMVENDRDSANSEALHSE